MNKMTEITNKPVLRFTEFNDEWEEKNLGDEASFLKGKGISKLDILENGNLECIRYGQLYTEYREVINNIVSRTNLDSKDLVLSQYNDVIIPASGETQLDIATASCVLKDGVALGGDLNIIRSDINGVFLSYYLNNTKKQDIASLAQGVSVVHLYSTQLKSLKLNLPIKQEQTKIANFLTSVDTKIDQLTKKKELLENYKKSVMQKIFSQEIRFKDDDGNYYPEWEEKKLGDICCYKNGGSYESLVCNDGLYNLITLNSIDINGKLKSNHKKISTSDNSLNKGDLVMVLSDVAHGYFLGLSDIIPNDTFVLNQRMGALKPNIDVNRYFLKTFININQYYFKLMGQGSSQKNLSKDDILKFNVFLPINNEQTKIADFLTSIDKKIDLVNLQLEKVKTWKQGLLQQMFI